MQFKAAQITDLHIGACRNITKGSLDYLRRHREVLWAWLDSIVREGCDFALVAGDIFEGASTTVEEFLLAYEFFTELGRRMEAVVSPGNHDLLAHGVFQTDRLKRMKIPNVTFTGAIPESVVVRKLHMIPLNDPTPIMSVLACPWTGLKEQDVFNEYLTTHHKGEQIVMLHECFKGIITDEGYRPKGGVQIPDMYGVQWWACGDIHKYQKLGLEHAWFSGSPCQMDFGEKTKKGYIIIEGDTEQDRAIPFTHRFIELPPICELHTVASLADITNIETTPHWFKLRCKPSEMPSYLPPCVKVTEPLPVKIDTISDVTQQKGSLVPVQVDYTEGVNELLTEAKYSAEEIELTIAEIKAIPHVNQLQRLKDTA